MRTTVVVVPRERFTSLPASLRSLFRTVTDDVPVIVVEGASPERIRVQLAELAQRRSFRLVSAPHMLTANEARNRGVAAAETDCVVIADNDIEYEQGWLEALERHVTVHGSDVVGGVTCIGPPPATTIHQAGARLEARRVDGGIALVEHINLAELPLLGAELPGIANQVCEFHCMLFRRSLLEEVGSFDERLVTRDHLDFSLRAMVVGARLTFAADSVVTYMAQERFDPVDLQYHLFRWSDELVVRSLDAFEETWGVAIDRDLYRFSWAAKHRARAVEAAYPRARRVLGEERFRRWYVARLEKKIFREQSRARGDLVQAVPPAPPRKRVDEVIAGLVVPIEQEAATGP